MTVVSEVTAKAEKISKTNPKDNTDEITAKVKAELKESFAGNRLVNAYPNFTTLKTKIKEIAEETAKKGKAAAQKGKKVVVNTAEKGKKVVNNGRKKVGIKAKQTKDEVMEKIKNTKKQK